MYRLTWQHCKMVRDGWQHQRFSCCIAAMTAMVGSGSAVVFGLYQGLDIHEARQPRKKNREETYHPTAAITKTKVVHKSKDILVDTTSTTACRNLQISHQSTCPINKFGGLIQTWNYLERKFPHLWYTWMERERVEGMKEMEGNEYLATIPSPRAM